MALELTPSVWVATISSEVAAVQQSWRWDSEAERSVVAENLDWLIVEATTMESALFPECDASDQITGIFSSIGGRRNPES